MLPSQRDLFDVPRDICYLNAAAWTPLPLSSIAVGQEGAALKSRPWDIPASYADDVCERARRAAAAMIGADAEDIALIPSVGYGFSTAAKVLDLPAGSRIVTLHQDHTSPVLEWLSRSEQSQLQIVSVSPGEDGDWTAAVLAALAEPSRAPVTVASISSIHWSDAGAIDLDRVASAIRAIDGRLLVDATHAAGVMDLDVTRIDPDFMVFPTYKWLLGPYGRAFLYAAKRHQDGIPLEQTSYGRKRVVAEDPVYFMDLDYVENARRYDMGERDFFVSLAVAANSMELLTQWGLDKVRARLTMLTECLATGLQERQVPVTILPDHLRAPNIVSLGFPGGMPEDLAQRLAAAKVYAAPRLGRLRISPHVYNDEEDCARCVEVLSEVLR